MIVDASALVAILRHEPERLTFAKALDEAGCLRLSAATYLELSIVIDGRNDPVLSRAVDELIERFNIVIEPVTVEQAKVARQAYLRQRQRAPRRTQLRRLLQLCAGAG